MPHDKLVTMDTEEEKKFEWIGHFNSFPPNWREITEKELAQETLWMRYTPVAIIYKQMHNEKAKEKRDRYIDAHLFVYHNGTGVAVHMDYWGEGYYDNPKPKEPLKHIRFFKFAKCVHEMAHVATLGICYNRYRCTKCQYTEDVDSSD